MTKEQFDGYTYIEGGVCAAKGFLANGLNCGINPDKKKNDLGMIYSEKECTAAAVYTQNKVKGAPILVTKENLTKSGQKAKAVIVNSKNANTCNANGVEVATKVCELTAKELGIKTEEVIVASTGVIGQPMSVEPFAKGIPEIVKGLSAEGHEEAAKAIMTTDTVKKEVAVSFEIQGKTCHLGGMAKGSGMIHPNMATTLNFVTTDVAISGALVQKALSEIVKVTYNCLSVDGDTSTNDMVSVMANGMAGNEMIETENACSGAKDLQTAITVAKSVIGSSLLKCAMFGEDANWGRVLCAIGYADAEFDIMKVNVDLVSSAGTIAVCRNGAGVEFSEEFASKVLAQDEIYIHVDLQDGQASAKAWGCDLTYDYVKINGDYRS